MKIFIFYKNFILIELFRPTAFIIKTSTRNYRDYISNKNECKYKNDYILKSFHSNFSPKIC